ncbi:hypothetical protein N9I56_02215 [Alphaproteobacteria bacterium]|nr:hypothetical protein [Alphaproteobacteria bacterium]
MAMLIPMIAAILYALAAILTRGKCRTVKPIVLATTLNMCLIIVGLLVSAALLIAGDATETWIDYPFLLGSWVAMSQLEWLVMGMLAMLIVLIGIGLAKAYQSAPSAIIATFDYSYLLFAALWGFVFFSEVPDALSATGMFLIFGAGLLVISPSSFINRLKITR